MKSDFLLAITQLSAEKNLPREVIITAVEAALVSAYRKDNFAANQNLDVKINPTNGKVQVWAEKIVVEELSDSRSQISLDEARKVKPDAELDDEVMIEDTPHNAGRIAAQTAKQVILQRLHEAEHSAIFEEFAERESSIVNGIVQRIEPRQVLVDLGRTEAILPPIEQSPNERYRIGQRLKVVVLEVVRTNRGPRVVVSRSHPDLIRRLFEIEVPEIFNEVVELKSVAREAGSRSKVAVAALQEGVDPVGCCVGLRGIRIQNIVSELNGEKIDVVQWSDETSTLIANGLSPAQIINVELDEEEMIATVVVPDRQLSLAIGKEGQNVRLAAKLTGWRIDIKSASAAEAEKVEESPESLIEPEDEEFKEEEPVPLVAEEIPAGTPVGLEPALKTAEAVEPSQSKDAEVVVPPVPFEPPPSDAKFELRFAEDISGPGPAKSQAKPKKKKKKGRQDKEINGDEVGVKKSRRVVDVPLDEDEEY
ncbi:transcription termination factor NusA [Chloroflexota bacterium]